MSIINPIITLTPHSPTAGETTQILVNMGNLSNITIYYDIWLLWSTGQKELLSQTIQLGQYGFLQQPTVNFTMPNHQDVQIEVLSDFPFVQSLNQFELLAPCFDEIYSFQ